MAGQKGRSGGIRPGAGRKPRERPADTTPAEPPPNAPSTPKQTTRDPLEYLLDVMQDQSLDEKLRVRAAVAAAQYKHTKRSDGGKKEETVDKAKVAGKGKFATSTAPLALVRKSG